MVQAGSASQDLHTAFLQETKICQSFTPLNRHECTTVIKQQGLRKLVLLGQRIEKAL